MDKTFTTNKGRSARLVPKKNKYLSGAGSYKIQVEIDSKWTTVVSNTYAGNSVIEKVKVEW